MPFHAPENTFLNQLPTAEKIFVIPLHTPEKKLPTEENAAVIPFQAFEKTPPNHCAIPENIATIRSYAIVNNHHLKIATRD